MVQLGILGIGVVLWIGLHVKDCIRTLNNEDNRD